MTGSMEDYTALLWILCALFAVILAAGICIKRYTKRRLRDIDAFQGIVKKKDCIGKPVAIQVDFTDYKKINKRGLQK